MLPKTRKIPRAMFPAARSPRRTYRRGAFSLAVFSAENQGAPSRCAIVVSKKTAKTAPVRNRIRRQGYAVLARLLPHVRPGHLLILYPAKESLALPYADIERAIGVLLAEARLISNPGPARTQ